MKKMASRASVLLLILVLLTPLALATTYTIPAGSGSLSYSVTVTTKTCLLPPPLRRSPAEIAPVGTYQTYYLSAYSSFSYTLSGVTTPLSGGDSTISNGDDAQDGGCGPASKYPPVTFIAPTVEITFTPSGTTGGSAVVVPGQTGYVDPKYIVVGVTYAPPGPSSNTFVQYVNSTFVGVTESLSQSFTGTTMSSVSLTYGINIPLVANGKITNTYSTTNSQTSKTTSTVTTSIQVQQGEKTFGTGNYFAPVNNDYDLIWVWLNPVAIFTVYPSESPLWNGYGFDGTDQSGMDIVPIALGYLNGHFGSIPPDIQVSLNRSWAANQIWPSGQGPALTSADLTNIAAADPFSVSSYGTTYIGYVPPSPQTSDYRFTLSSCSSVSSFNYLQADPSQSAEIYTCGLTYTNLSTQTQEISTTHSETFSVDDAFSGTGFFSDFSADLKASSTLSWTTDAQSSITTSTTSTANLSVQGPPCNNMVQDEGPCVPVYDASGNEPTQFEVYQDNMFGTFMFTPVHYY
jgi:hypothetical protein